MQESRGGDNGGWAVAGDPVFVKTGEFQMSFTDLSFVGRSMSIEITRTYGSQRDVSSVFGYGWDFSYDYKVLRRDVNEGDPNVVVFVDDKSCNYEYTQDGNDPNLYTLSTDFDRYFVYDDTNDTFTLVVKGGLDYTFDANDYLASITGETGDSITFTYDANHFLTMITDDVDRDIIIEYNNDGFIEKITDFAGRTWEYTYDASTDDLLTVTGPGTTQYPDGLTTTYGYDDYHNLNEIKDANDQTIVTNFYNQYDKVYRQDIGDGYYLFDFEPAINTTTFTDREGYETKKLYNNSGQLVKDIVYTKDKQDSFMTEYVYDANGLRTRTVYPKGNCIDYTYDPNGNITGKYIKADVSKPNDANDPNVMATIYTYDPNWPSKVRTERDPLGNIMTFDYNDVTGFLEKITYPTVDGNTPIIEYTYDAQERLETLIDPSGMVQKYAYYADNEPNGWGRLQKVIVDYNDTDGLNLTTEYTYDAFGNLVEIKDPNGNVTKHWYNNLGQLIQTQSPDPFNYVTKYYYDKNGNMNKVERETGDVQNPWQLSWFSFDELSNMTKWKDALGNVTIFGYNLNEEPNMVVDAEGNRTVLKYNEKGYWAKVTDANDGVTEFGYDDNGNLTKITDANDQETDYSYDSFDRISKITYPDDSNESFTYDKNQNVTSVKNRGGQFIHFEYDSLNRRIIRNLPAEPNIVASYNTTGLVQNVNDGRDESEGGGSWIYSYDRVGRVNDVNYIGCYQVKYEHDDMSRRTRLTYPDGMYITYEYDELGRLNKIVDDSNNTVAEFQHDKLSRRVLLTLGNDANAVYNYDLANHLEKLSNNINSTDSINFEYPDYDKFGNRLSMKVDDTDEHEYKYDKLYQLVDVNYPDDPNVCFSYDKLSNRKAVVVAGVGTTVYSPNDLNQYRSVNGTNYHYDANGNLTDDGVYEYTYDCENRLIEVDNGSTVVKYKYDYLGRRIIKDIDGDKYMYAYDGVQVIVEYRFESSDWDLKRKFIYGPGIDEPLCMIQVDGESETRYYYHFDGLGSVAALSNVAGNIVEGYSYDVFGATTINTSAGTDGSWVTPDGSTASTSDYNNPYMFTARRYDDECGLYYYRARHYAPAIGRFLQVDPSSYEGDMHMNLYIYAHNNPIMYVDTFGLNAHLIDCYEPCWKLPMANMKQACMECCVENSHEYDNACDAEIWGNICAVGGTFAPPGPKNPIPGAPEPSPDGASHNLPTVVVFGIILLTSVVGRFRKGRLKCLNK